VDGWAKQPASEPDDHGVEWLTLSNGVRLLSRPTSLAHLKRRASVRSGRKPGRDASGDDSTRATSSGRKASPTQSQPDGEASGLEVLPAKSGHALTSVYMKSTDNDHCWWCDPENNSGTHQTRGHLFKHRHKWKEQQAAMWARFKEATKKGKQVVRGRATEASLAVLDFVRSAHVGRMAPPVEGN